MIGASMKVCVVALSVVWSKSLDRSAESSTPLSQNWGPLYLELPKILVLQEHLVYNALPNGGAVKE